MQYSWHLLTGLGVFVFMLLVECLRFAPLAEQSGAPKLRYDGKWPFMVYLVPDKKTQKVKKDS
jgi:dihydroceramidase